MDFNLTKLIKDMDKTMITERGGVFKLVVTYAGLGYFEEHTMTDRSRQSYQRGRAFFRHDSLDSVCSVDQALPGILECVTGKGYDFE
jgi:hypothetical protein